MSQRESTGQGRRREAAATPKAPGPGSGKAASSGPGSRQTARVPRAAERGEARERGAARGALLDAARAEFDEAGFEGTDTNRIARRAGYAPQTFYRHFADKTTIFVETYHRWVEG